MVAVGGALMLAMPACDALDGQPAKIVADGTVYIVGVLEASPDTVIHHPQVYVGTLSDPQDRGRETGRYPDHRREPAMFLPDFWAQVVKKAAFMSLNRSAEHRATVTMTGPLSDARERAVVLTHESAGVYGDVQKQLPVVPDARYRLDVRMPDGRAFSAETHTPAPYHVEAPDTLRSATQYIYHGPGNWTELGAHVLLRCVPAPDEQAPLSIYTYSQQREKDAQTFLVPDWRDLLFAGRGDHLRATTHLNVSTHGAYPDYDNCSVAWGMDANGSRWDETPVFIRVAQVSAGLARWYEVAFPDFAMRDPPGAASVDPWSDTNQTARMDANSRRDRSYLPRITNVRLEGAAPLPADAFPDVVGVFGGMTSRYLTRTLVPVRSFDPDTLVYQPPRP